MNNEPDYEDNLYFENNEIQAKDVACDKISLTELWKKGQLPNGLYYVENIYGTITTSEYFGESKFFVIGDDNVKKVLAPVPSYEEWKASYNCMLENEVLRLKNAQLKEQINHLSKTQARQFVDNQKLQVKAEKAKNVVNIETAKQIKQLKELLKECRPYISRSATSRMMKNSAGHKKDMKLLTKIDEVLK